jgi:hypothetical protein
VLRELRIYATVTAVSGFTFLLVSTVIIGIDWSTPSGALPFATSLIIAVAAWFMGRASATIFGKDAKSLWFRTILRDVVDEEKSAVREAKIALFEAEREFKSYRERVTILIDEKERLQREVVRLQRNRGKTSGKRNRINRLGARGRIT